MHNKKKNTDLALSIVALFLSMIVFTFAASPMYNLFCKVTGFAGTTMRSDAYSSLKKGNKIIKIEFDTNVDKSLPWHFLPKNQPMDLRVGEIALVFYEAENYSDKNMIGTAVYNVSPQKAGKYFVKINCFCFEEQLLHAKQKLLMPVSFYIDSAIENDDEMRDVGTITLSYSFFKVREVE